MLTRVQAFKWASLPLPRNNENSMAGSRPLATSSRGTVESKRGEGRNKHYQRVLCTVYRTTVEIEGGCVHV